MYLFTIILIINLSSLQYACKMLELDVDMVRIGQKLHFLRISSKVYSYLINTNTLWKYIKCELKI